MAALQKECQTGFLYDLVFMSWMMVAFHADVTMISHLQGWQQRIYMGIHGGISPSMDQDA